MCVEGYNYIGGGRKIDYNIFFILGIRAYVSSSIPSLSCTLYTLLILYILYGSGIGIGSRRMSGGKTRGHPVGHPV